ncbi:MAG: hypothetical protein IJQ50_04230 [Clostridia bacterium]|nr:hypothetical protein [Clostridia bacterium]
MADKEKKIKTKRSKKTSFFIIFILVIVALFTGVRIIKNNKSSSVSMETVLIGTMEDKEKASGYIIRDEAIINSPATGMISFRAEEEKRVSSGATIAVVFTGDVNDDIKTELSSLHARINEVVGSTAEKNLYAVDSVMGTAQIANDISAIRDLAYSGNVSSVSEYKDNIIRIIRKSDSGAMTTLEQLESKKKELENSISGSAVAVYSPKAGILSSKLDGYEEWLNILCLDKINPSYLNNIKKTEYEENSTVNKDKPCLKIIDNYEWYFAANMDEKWRDDLKEGSKLYIRFSDVSEDKLDVEIYSISEPEKGKISVVLKGSGIFPGMYSMREINAEIIKKTYTGFKISKSAVHIDNDGKYYVYINSDGTVRRRDVNILYSNDTYAVIKEDNSADNNLLLYDEVIISGSGIKEGKGI